MEHINS